MGAMRATMAAALAGVVTASIAGASNAVNVWAKVSARVRPVNERLAAVPFTPVAVDYEALVAELEKDAPNLEFELPGRVLTCTVKKSGVMHPDLAAKFATIKSLSGKCLDGSDVSLTIDTVVTGSLQVTFYTSEGIVYVDNIANGVSMLYSHADAEARGVPPDMDVFLDETDQVVLNELKTSLGGRLGLGQGQEGQKQDQASPDGEGYKFRVAILVTRDYGRMFGNTTESIVLNIVNTMSRVNSIFLRELGVFFELIPESDKLICIERDRTCDHWPSYRNLPQQNNELLLERNVSLDMYDIGYALTRANVITPRYATLCTDLKAASLVGLYQPLGDLYWIQVNVFTLGYNLAASYTHRDCPGYNFPGPVRESAVEPGGGVTLMSLIGECGQRNVQSFREQHFNSINLQQMRDLVEGRVANGCGESFTTGRVRPVVSTSAGLCVVPKGNFVQLTGRVDNMESTSVVYAWDRVDPGLEDYLDVDSPRFRPWSPGPLPSRSLPNMYYLTLGLGTQLGEIPPKASVPGDDEMTFRFVARTKSQGDLGQSPFDIGPVGAFDFKDVEVHYKSTEEPLVITSQLTELVVGDEVDITWTGGTLSGYVEILLAVNTMFEALNFRYELDLKDLEWVSVASVPNNGSATITVPQLTSSLFQQVNLMIRSTGNEDCYFFDLVPRLTFVGGTNGTAAPTAPTLQIPTTAAPVTPAPTAAPVTPAPTAATVTPAPTAAPLTLAPSTSGFTLSPTVGAPDAWMCNSTAYNQSNGCHCECGVRDPDCDAPYEIVHCSERSYNASNAECNVETNTCIIKSDTTSPTIPPTVEPTSEIPLSGGMSRRNILLGACFGALVIGVFVVWRKKAKQRRELRGSSVDGLHLGYVQRTRSFRRSVNR